MKIELDLSKLLSPVKKISVVHILLMCTFGLFSLAIIFRDSTFSQKCGELGVLCLASGFINFFVKLIKET